MATLADRVLLIIESIADKRAAAELVVTLVEAATKAELAAAQQIAEEAERAARREAERVRKAEYRALLSRHVPGTDKVSQGHPGTTRDMVSPAPPSPSGSLSVPDPPERAIPVPGLDAFPVVGGTEKDWRVPGELLEQHRKAFPDLDVLAEYRKALAYVQSHPAKRKTPKGMPLALFRWLTRAQEGGKGARPPPAKEHAASAKGGGMALFCDWHRDARNDGKPNKFRPKDDCPSCKHLKAANRPREENTQLALGGNR